MTRYIFTRYIVLEIGWEVCVANSMCSAKDASSVNDSIQPSCGQNLRLLTLQSTHGFLVVSAV